MNIKNDIRSLMLEYERLFSKNERRIFDSLKRITAALHGEVPGRIPVIQVTQTILYPRHEIFYSREKNLISLLCNINLTLAHDTDYVPYLDPFEGVTILAEAFGCRVEVPENGDPWVKEPLIKENPYDVYLLKKPARDNEVYNRVFETLRYFEKKSGGIIPVGATDPQGPLDVASLIWNNQDFLLACVLHKKEVHHLLELVTEAFIEFYSMQYGMLKNIAYPVHSFPLVNSNDGISISDDEAVLLSPGLYEEFAVPYLNRISKEFGGLYYHCCGDYGFLLEKILSIEGLRAINGHLSPEEFRPEYIGRVTGSGKGLFIGISDREIGWENPNWSSDEIMEIYDSYYIPSVIKNSGGRGVVLVGYGGYTGYFDIDEETMSSIKGRDRGQTVGVGGHPIEKSPLVNVPVEKKNENFSHILSLIERYLNRREEFPE